MVKYKTIISTSYPHDVNFQNLMETYTNESI